MAETKRGRRRLLDTPEEIERVCRLYYLTSCSELKVAVRMGVSLAADVVEFCCKHLAHWLPQFPCTTQMRWGGCSAAQEIAFGIANLIAYLEAALERGVVLEDLAPKMHWHATTDNDLFEEIAKFRAGRKLWAKIAGQLFGVPGSIGQ